MDCDLQQVKMAGNNYDSIMRSCMALSNYHAKLHPQRSGDGKFYRKYGNRIHDADSQTARKIKQVHNMYREKGRRRIKFQFRSPQEETQDAM